MPSLIKLLQPSAWQAITPVCPLAAERQLAGYLHRGFWQCMDTMSEKQKLEDLWNSGKAPWKTWGEG